MAFYKDIDRFGNELTPAPSVGQYAQLAPGGGGSQTFSAGNTLLQFDTLVSSYGTLVVPNAAASTMTLTAGYVYEVEACALYLSSVQLSNVAVGIYDGATLVGTQGYVMPVSHTNNQSSQPIAKAYIVATTTKTISVKAIQITGAATWQLQSPAYTGYANPTNYNGTIYNGYFTAKVIGTI